MAMKLIQMLLFFLALIATFLERLVASNLQRSNTSVSSYVEKQCKKQLMQKRVLFSVIVDY